MKTTPKRMQVDKFMPWVIKGSLTYSETFPFPRKIPGEWNGLVPKERNIKDMICRTPF